MLKLWQEHLQVEAIQEILACTEEKELLELPLEMNGKLKRYLSTTPPLDKLKPLMELYGKQLDLLRFDEFKNRDVADFKRVRALIEHENGLINHRLTWLLSAQGLLFAGLGVILNKDKWRGDDGSLLLLLIVCLIGLLTSRGIEISISYAGAQIDRIDEWWHKRKDSSYTSIDGFIHRQKIYEKHLQVNHPDLQYRQKKEPWNWGLLKIERTFQVAWLLIFFCLILGPCSKMLILRFRNLASFAQVHPWQIPPFEQMIEVISFSMGVFIAAAISLWGFVNLVKGVLALLLRLFNCIDDLLSA